MTSAQIAEVTEAFEAHQRKVAIDSVLVRALDLVGVVVLNAKLENDLARPWRLVYKIGKRIWEACYLDRRTAEHTHEIKLSVAKPAVGDIIIALYLAMQNMRRQLGDPPLALRVSESDLDVEFRNALVSIDIMKEISGATYTCTRSPTSLTFVAMFSLGDVAAYEHSGRTEIGLAARLVTRMGPVAVVELMKEYDALAARVAALPWVDPSTEPRGKRKTRD